MQFQNICPDSIQPVRSAAHHCKNWGKDVVTVPHSNSNWQPKVLPNLNAAAAAAPSVFCCDTWSVQKRLVRSLCRWWTCTLLIPLGFFFLLPLWSVGEVPCAKKKKINQIKGHAVLPIAKPWGAPRMSEANVVSGGKGRIHAGETGGGRHMGNEKQRRKGKEEICKLYTQAVEVVIRARRGVKGIQLYRRNRNTSATLISSGFIITLQIKPTARAKRRRHVHFLFISV